uniref:Lupus La protein n=1 Tax=Jaculus jaculus TaxID=51337 RepID=A0A8C5KSX3_JACJA
MAESEGNEKMAALEAKICWVPLEIMIKFNRLNRLTTGFKVIVEALSKSKARLMEISVDKTKIRQSPSKPLPEVTDEYKNDVKNRSVYIKGFPTDATLDDTKEWLEDKGQILNIQMRRTLHKTFKGSIFAVFDSIHSAKKFVETRGQKYKGTDLLILFKDDYFQNKVDAKLRARQDQEGRHKLGHAEMRSLEGKIGCLLKFSGDLDDQTCREDLHILFSNHGEIKWIDFVRGAKEGIILFKEKPRTHWRKDTLKKIIEDQQESLSKWKAKGRRFKGKGKGNRGAHPGSAKGKVHFQGRRTRFDSDSDCGPTKRGRDDRDRGEPASKYQKTENGSRHK